MEKLCKHCNLDLSAYNLGKRTNHVKFCEHNPNREKNIEKQRIVLQNNREKISADSRKQINYGVSKAWKDGKYSQRKSGKRPPMSDEQKKKLSTFRKSWLKENVENHPWKKSTKFISKPCEDLKNKLRNQGLIFEEEWTPLTDRYFAIDIAFPNQKIGIEVNGEQHYNRDGSLRSYYQKRHDLIEEEGWTLFELHYTKIYDDSQIGPIVQRIERLSSKQ